jgi:hypothetical protein
MCSLTFCELIEKSNFQNLKTFTQFQTRKILIYLISNFVFSMFTIRCLCSHRCPRERRRKTLVSSPSVICTYLWYKKVFVVEKVTGWDHRPGQGILYTGGRGWLLTLILHVPKNHQGSQAVINQGHRLILIIDIRWQ